MKKIFILFSFLCIRQTKAQTYVLIPDANFATYLQFYFPSAMNGNSLNITSTLVTTATQSINVDSHSISNLSGIQYFTSLTYLSCSQNALSSLPALPNSLTFLSCSNNYFLTSLSTLPNSLQVLDCNSNYSLTNLPALPNSLTFLNCSSNSLTSLPVLATSLQTLECVNNSLTNLPALPNSLTYLECGGNHLTALPALPNSLIYLLCTLNSLTSLPALPASLQTLDCGANSLTTLPTLPNSLQSLWCNNNNIDCFPVFPNSISSIYLNPNSYNCLPNYVLPAMNAYTTTPLCAPGNTNGCAIAGIKQLTVGNTDISIYPNPARGEFIIETTSSEIQMMQIFDLNGKLVLSENISGKATIEAKGLSEGVYNLTLKSGEGIINKKLVIVR